MSPLSFDHGEKFQGNRCASTHSVEELARGENRSHTNGLVHKEAGGESGDSVPSVNRKIVSFEDLAEGRKVVVIEFKGQHYRLRLTKSGRLVLTK